MTDQELSELLSHPRVRAFVERIAEQAAARAYSDALPALKKRVLQSAVKPTAKPVARPAAEGDMNYVDAAHFIGCPPNSIRGYACTGVLERGKLPATVTIKSCFAFKSTYKPRPSGRTSGNL